MNNLKLIEIFSSFTEKDWQMFKNFSLYNNHSNRNYMALIEGYHLEFQKGNIDKISSSKIFMSVYENKNFSYQTLKNRQSELLKIAEDFLGFSSFQNNNQIRNALLISEMNKRHLHKNILSLYNKVKVSPKAEIPDIDILYYLKEFELNFASSFLNTNEPQKYYNKLYESSKYMLALLLSSIYREGYEYLVEESYNIIHKNNLILGYLKSEIDEKYILDLASEEEKFFIIPVIYYCFYRSYKNEFPEKYIRIINKLYFNNEKFFNDSFKLDVYRCLSTYYLNEINKGNKKEYKNLFKIYKKKLKQGLTYDFEKCTYPANSFRDYVIVSLRNQKYKWASAFVKKYSAKLPDDIRDIEVSSSNVRIYFASGNFRKVLELTESTRTDNFVFYIDLSRFKLMAYYELGMYEEAFPEIDRANHYMKNRKDIPEESRRLNNRFFNFYNQLLKQKSLPKATNKDIILNKINKSVIPLKEWLLNKVAEL